MAKSCRFCAADTLARKINLTAAERAGTWGNYHRGCDSTENGLASGIAERREKKRQAEMTRRRGRGEQPRAKFIASTKAKGARPWELEGLSRATWYRRQNASTTLAA